MRTAGSSPILYSLAAQLFNVRDDCADSRRSRSFYVELFNCSTVQLFNVKYSSRLWCVMELFTFARSECLLYSNLLMDRRPRAMIEWLS